MLPERAVLGSSSPVGPLTWQPMLHVQRWQNWTQGCIALTNREIRELRRFVDVGTRVVILK